MKKEVLKPKNIIFIVLLLLMIIPHTRFKIQVFIHKGIALFSPSIIETDERTVLKDYNWTLIDHKGNTFTFEAAKEKVILVNFWATWCPPCVAELPSLQALYNDYQDKVVFVFISNEEVDTIHSFFAKEDYNFPVFKPQSNPPKTFEVPTIPRTFLIDKKGKIVIDKLGAANWNSDVIRNQLDALLLE